MLSDFDTCVFISAKKKREYQVSLQTAFFLLFNADSIQIEIELKWKNY